MAVLGMDQCDSGDSVLINSPDAALVASVKARLRGLGMRAMGSQPGLSFMEMTRQQRPQIAVLDRVDERPDAVQMEIALLKEQRHDVRIIVLSRRPSPQDAWVVECGIFFYMAAPAVTELIRVIQAARRHSPPADGRAARAATTAPPPPLSAHEPE